MKKHLVLTGILAVLLVFGTEVAQAQTVNLDAAIKDAVTEFSYAVKKDSKIAILAIHSSSTRMSNYLIEELSSNIANQRLFTVVDKTQLEKIQQEMNFRTSGELSDTSARSIGQKLNVQSVVIGTFEPIGDYYRFRLRAIDVGTAAIQATYSANVKNDQTVASLMGSGGSSGTAAGSSEDYEDFGGGQRFGTWALNAFVLPGLGSYVIMHDTQGGTVQLVTGVVGQIVFWVGAVNWYVALGKIDLHEEGAHEALYSAIGVTVFGGLIGIGNGVFNIVRSVSYHKPQPNVASLVDPDAWDIAILPGKGGIEKVRLAYTLQY